MTERTLRARVLIAVVVGFVVGLLAAYITHAIIERHRFQSIYTSSRDEIATSIPTPLSPPPPVPKNRPHDVKIFFVDSNGASVTGLRSYEIQCKQSGDLWNWYDAADTDETENGDGVYILQLTASEMNHDMIHIYCIGLGAQPWMLTLMPK